jgi:hypothetical protein
VELAGSVVTGNKVVRLSINRAHSWGCTRDSLLMPFDLQTVSNAKYHSFSMSLYLWG